MRAVEWKLGEVLFICSISLIVGVLCTILVYQFIGLEETQGLGNAICDQEYNMQFDTYIDGELSCKPKEVKQEIAYDGIKVLIKDE